MDDSKAQRSTAEATLPASEATRSRRPFASGETIDGRYRLLKPLEQGGMGEVWVAHNLALDVHVALKLILPEHGSEMADERLLREARAAAQLDHPAVVRVFDVGRAAGGEPYLVMELLDGEALFDTLARERRIDPAAAVRLLLPIAGALAAMHAKGMVHRDVKPENIFLAKNDAGHTQPKLIDFGVAKLSARSGLPRLTRRGSAIGTPDYMAPEQVQGTTDARADVWALCVVLYEMIAGVAPFVGETYPLLLGAILAASPAPLSAHGVRDDELSEIVARGLRPIDDRWPSMRALGKALATWLWARGDTEDVTGKSLRSAWLADEDMRSLSAPPASQHVMTRRMPAPVLDRPWPAPAPAPAPSAAPSVASAPQKAQSSTPAAAIPLAADPASLRRSNRVPAVIVGVGLLGAVAIVGISQVRRTAAPPVPTAVPSSSAEPPATASAGADAPAPPAPTALPSATPPPAATQVRRQKPPRDAGPRPGVELKNPFR